MTPGRLVDLQQHHLRVKAFTMEGVSKLGSQISLTIRSHQQREREDAISLRSRKERGQNARKRVKNLST